MSTLFQFTANPDFIKDGSGQGPDNGGGCTVQLNGTPTIGGQSRDVQVTIVAESLGIDPSMASNYRLTLEEI